jgi:hypothetical protein
MEGEFVVAATDEFGRVCSKNDCGFSGFAGEGRKQSGGVFFEMVTVEEDLHCRLSPDR